LNLSAELHRIAGQAKKVAMQLRIGRKWSDRNGARYRDYPDYESYLAHQRIKLDAMRGKSLANHDVRFYDALRGRLDRIPVSLEGLSVLCLAARQGTEVRAFIDAGAFAVGIDLNPGAGNKYVVSGDFHALQFAPESVGLVYTNSIDHAFDVDRLLTEIARVLVSDGLLVLEVGRGTENGDRPGFYETFSWSRPDDLLERVPSGAFKLETRSEFDLPWPGVQFVLRKTGLVGAE
jgi:SAM-dependent methyltransferase